MSLIHKHGENKYQNGKDDGIEKIIVNLLKSNEKPEDVAVKTEISLEKNN